MLLFLLLAGCEVYSVLMLGGDCVWFCMPEEVGIWRMIVNFLLFGFVLVSQFGSYKALLYTVPVPNIRSETFSIDWRLGFWSWPGIVIASLALGAGAIFYIVLAFILFQVGYMGWIIWKFAHAGAPMTGIFIAFFYLGGALVTLMVAALYLPMLILVVIALVALQIVSHVASSSTTTVEEHYYH